VALHRTKVKGPPVVTSRPTKEMDPTTGTIGRKTLTAHSLSIRPGYMLRVILEGVFTDDI
jgi:hypothetical protein